MDEKRLVDGATALAEKQSRVIKIEPAERPQNVRLRVAAYTRVSSDSEDQLNSFAAQNRYYTELISGKAEWRMVDIYADEGISGTSVAKRDDFQRMMADCRRGLIDQILVKSISRFARNTKDCLQNIRELKELGVNVRFEREGIDTVNVSSELITAIYAAFAQKESESISGNMRWSYQRRMESGTFLPPSTPYGYRIINKKIEIDPERAVIICKIFQWYLNGISKEHIAHKLNEAGVLSNQNKAWRAGGIHYILTNERYIGDSLWQKTYTTEAIPTVRHRNTGACEQYYVEGTHPPIISKEVFTKVQILIQMRKENYGKSPSETIHSAYLESVLDEKVDVWYNEGNDEISERTQYEEDPVYLSWKYLPQPHGRVRDEGLGKKGGTGIAISYRISGYQSGGDRQPSLSSGTAQAGRAWELLRRPCRTAVDKSGLRRIRSPDRHGPGQPPGYVPHLRRRLCRQDVPPDGPHRSSRQCGRPMVHRGLRGDLAGCAGWLPRTFERIHDRTR